MARLFCQPEQGRKKFMQLYCYSRMSWLSKDQILHAKKQLWQLEAVTLTLKQLNYKKPERSIKNAPCVGLLSYLQSTPMYHFTIPFFLLITLLIFVPRSHYQYTQPIYITFQGRIVTIFVAILSIPFKTNIFVVKATSISSTISSRIWN